MTDRVKDAEAVFRAALDKPTPQERAAFLDGACAGQPDLLQRVRDLLAAQEESGGSLDAPLVGPATVDLPLLSEGPGTQIGPYKLLQHLGAGGMGVVFLAEQQEPVRRHVALKIIKAGMDSAHVLARFEAERQALALMDHPNIARILDAGATASERPYVVMELVKGIPITKFCDQEHLTPRERLELFIPVCQAVQHAHQKGIIHRDLKPSNVLIALYDGKAVPKVIDFGVAKATAQKLTERTLFTEVGQMVGTLEYMAPEQAELNNLDIDTRADIYALGVLLYTLLTGSPPFTARQLRSAAFTEMLRMIREVEPPKPSTRLSSSEELPAIAARRKLEPSKLTRLVRGELDWIVMKCLEKERGRRYDTANGLARDLERYLRDEPVLAGPPTAAYRLRKLLRRNRGPVLAGGLLVLALVVGIVGTAWGLVRTLDAEGLALQRLTRAEDAEADAKEKWKRAEKAEAEARDQRDKANAAEKQARDALDTLADEVVETFLRQHGDRLGEKERAFLRKVAGFYKQFTANQADSPATRHLRGLGYYRVGTFSAALKDNAAAEPAYRQALKLQQQLVAEFPTVPAYRKELAATHNNLGVLLKDLGQEAEAEMHYRRAIDLRDKLAVEFRGVPRSRQQQAQSHHNLANLLRHQGQHGKAGEHYRIAQELLKTLAADFPAVADYRQAVGLSHSDLAVSFYDQGKHAQSEEQYRLGQNVLKQLAADFPAVSMHRMGLVGNHLNLGILLDQQGKYPQAEAQFRQALELVKKLVADFPAVPEYRQELARAYDSLGNLRQKQRQFAQAEEQHRLALEVRTKLAADFPTEPAHRYHLGLTQHNLGLMLHLADRRVEAEEHYRLAVELQKNLAADFPAVPEYRHKLAGNHNSLGVLLDEQKQPAQAEEEFRLGLDLLEKLAADFPKVPAYRVSLGGACVNFGNLLRNSGQAAAALPLYAKAVAALKPVHEQNPQLGLARLALRNAHGARAKALDALQRPAEAAKDWAQMLQLLPAAEQPIFRQMYAFSLARAGDHVTAAQEANVLARHPKANEFALYKLAWIHALCAAAVKDDAKLQEQYATRAVALLRQAVGKGFRELAHLKKNDELDGLRQRDDFRRLLADLEEALQPGRKREKQP